MSHHSSPRARAHASLIAIAVASAVVWLAGAVAPRSAVAQRLTIEGRVWADRNGDGVASGDEEPLAGVAVLLLREDAEVGRQRTGPDGRYRFARLRRGLYKVKIEESSLPQNLGLGPASYWERNFAGIASSEADFGFVPRDVIERLAEEAARFGPDAGEETEQGQDRDPARDPFGRDPGEDRSAGGPEEAAPEDPSGIAGDGPESPASGEEVARPGRPAGETSPERGLPPLVLAAIVLGVVLLLVFAGRALLARGASSGTAGGTGAAMTIERFLAHRDRQAWAAMESAYQRLPAADQASVFVRQQRAFGLNRAGSWRQAEEVLREIQQREGSSPETNGMLGRIYKDRWEAARDAGDAAQAEEHLDKAVTHYREGHASDPSNPYPGINALTLMESYPSHPEARDGLLGAVQSAADKRSAEYWDHATRLELALLLGDAEAARAALDRSLAAPKTPWQVATTSRNLRLLREGRERKGEATPEWAREMENELGRGD